MRMTEIVKLEKGWRTLHVVMTIDVYEKMKRMIKDMTLETLAYHADDVSVTMVLCSKDESTAHDIARLSDFFIGCEPQKYYKEYLFPYEEDIEGRKYSYTKVITDGKMRYINRYPIILWKVE